MWINPYNVQVTYGEGEAPSPKLPAPQTVTTGAVVKSADAEVLGERASKETRDKALSWRRKRHRIG